MKRLIVVLVIMPMLLLGCTNALVNEDDYERLSIGMTPAEVQAILGKAKPSDSVTLDQVAVTTLTWRNPHGSWLSVKYLDGKLVDKTESGLD